MADTIEQRLEQFVPTFEQLISLGIFTKAETKAIISKRRSFEYSIKSTQATFNTFLKYIEYEASVIQLTEVRKEEKGIESDQRLLCDSDWTKHVHSIYKRATERFSGDIKVWNQYFDFCQQTHAAKALGKAFSKCIRIHGNNSDLWIRAAKWEMEENNNTKLAIEYMQHAIELIPNDPNLYAMFCETILYHSSIFEKRREIMQTETNTDYIRAPLAIFNEAIQKCEDNATVLKLFIEKFQKYEQDTERLIEKAMTSENPHVLSMVAKFDENPKEKYQEFIQSKPSRELKIEYAKYLGENHDGEELNNILDEIEEFDDLETEMFTQMLIDCHMYQDADDLINDVLTTPKLQELKLLLIDKLTEDTVEFKNAAISFLKQHNTPILNNNFLLYMGKRRIPEEEWIPLVKSRCTLMNPDNLAKVVQFTLALYKEDAAQKLVLNIMPLIVPTASFINIAIQVAESQAVVDPARVRSLYELNTNKWGTSDSKVWLDYIEYEYKQKNIKRVEALRNKANQELEDPSEFNKLYQEMVCKKKLLV